MIALTTSTDCYGKGLEVKEVSLNENESAVYNNLILDGDEFESCWSLNSKDFYVEGLTPNQIKGYLSSLSLKGVIEDVELSPNNHTWITCATIDEIDNI